MNADVAIQDDTQEKQIGLDAVANRVGDLPALPHVAAKTLRLTEDPNISAGGLEREILRDPALTIRVLRLANSARFGVSTPISTVSSAIVRVGLSTVRDVVIAECMKSLFDRPRSSFKDKILWEHALATALVSRFIAEEGGYASGERAFIAGLIHDVGKTVMDTKLLQEYERVIELVYNGDAASFMVAERDVFGFDHAEVGFLVVESWQLPLAIGEAVRYHHDTGRAVIDPSLCALIGLANGICIKLEIGPEKQPDLDLEAISTNSVLRLSGEYLCEVTARAQRSLAESESLFEMG